jgi:hypothetical protein
MYTLLFLLYSLTFSLHADQGPTVDPNGAHVTTYSDEGSGMCPHGGHAASPNSDVGPRMDDNG